MFPGRTGLNRAMMSRLARDPTRSVAHQARAAADFEAILRHKARAPLKRSLQSKHGTNSWFMPSAIFPLCCFGELMKEPTRPSFSYPSPCLRLLLEVESWHSWNRSPERSTKWTLLDRRSSCQCNSPHLDGHRHPTMIQACGK